MNKQYLASPLKWAGSKRTVLPQLIPTFQKHFKFYKTGKFIEPFTGSGVVAMNVECCHKTINDINPDLVNLYRCCKENPTALIEMAQTLFTIENCTTSAYNKLRTEFNSRLDDKIRMAALFLYLNKHGFNGLCRYNRDGKFNVPPHSCCKEKRTVGPALPVAEIMQMHEAFKDAVIYNHEFKTVMDRAMPGDLVYCDPPYFAWEQSGGSFTSYAKEGFGITSQIELAYLASLKANEGVTVVVSNHATPTCIQLYKELGAKLKFLDVIRSVSADSETRGTAKELIAIFEGR